MIRHRGHDAAEAPLVHRIASVLLRYPDARTLSLLDDVAAALPAIRHRATREGLAGFTARLRALGPTEAAERYVATFDHSRRRALHLTYYRHGDTRARGMALLALKHVYRQAGHEPPEDELPDYLPLVLEFAALAPEAGRRVLLQCRPGLELLRQALHEGADPYAAVVDAVCAGLPEQRSRDREVLRRLAADGPPKEDVGLEPFGQEPFAPPEYLASPTFATGAARPAGSAHPHGGDR